MVYYNLELYKCHLDYNMVVVVVNYNKVEQVEHYNNLDKVEEVDKLEHLDIIVCYNYILVDFNWERLGCIEGKQFFNRGDTPYYRRNTGKSVCQELRMSAQCI